MRHMLFLLFLLPVVACHAYTPADLPTGWEIDLAKIQGTLLSAITVDAGGGTPAGNDPNTWLRPIGAFVRDTQTNQWVSRIEWVTTNSSDTVSVSHNPLTGMSTTWKLEGWIMPGVNYKTVDAYTWKGKSGSEKKQRYTVFAIGYVPDTIIPILY